MTVLAIWAAGISTDVCEVVVLARVSLIPVQVECHNHIYCKGQMYGNNINNNLSLLIICTKRVQLYMRQPAKL